jgi:hemin uptake protein HemP
MILNIRNKGWRVDSTPGAEPPRPPKTPARRIQSEVLFEGRSEVVILHRDEEYRLRVTKSDKLILTK